jgi:tetratricopeptide (TPR) repeat protein
MVEQANGSQAERIEKLVEKAQGLIKAGSLQEAHNALREANSLDSNDATIQRAFGDLRDAESGKPVVALCEKWLHSHSDDDGEITLDYIHKQTISDEWSSQAMAVMMRYQGDADMADQITGYLLKCRGAQKYLAQQMKDAPTVTYRNVYDRGDDSINALNNILLDPQVWDSEKDRIAAERDVFQLALAQMMRAGEDHPERAMRSISRMLAVEAPHLKGLIDADGFDIILVHLDIRLAESLRREATIATSKLFELAPENAEALIAQFVVNRVKKPTADGLIVSFSAAAAVFPMAPAAAEKLFLSEGFLPSLTRLVRKWKSKRLEQAALNLLDTACMTSAAREGIRQHCQEWIAEFAENLKDQKKSMQARKILMKLKSDSKEGEW